MEHSTTLENMEMTQFNNFYQGRRVFVTGHTGFKGSWLGLYLAFLGAQVTGFSLAPPTEPSLFELARLEDLVNSHIADIRDAESLTSVMRDSKPEIVFHLAAQSLVRNSYEHPVDTYATNVMGTVHLFEAVRCCPSVKVVVNITSDKCYENREWIWGYRESDRLGGFDPYSNSKACSELVTAAYRSSYFNPKKYDEHGVAVATARAGNVIGGGDWAADRLVPDIIRSILAGNVIRIRNPHAIRPWQHVLEPLAGYLTLTHRLYENGPEYADSWNFGPLDADSKPVEWIVHSICHLWGESAHYEIDAGYHPHEAHYLKLDCSKSQSILGWKPRWSLERALQSLIEWVTSFRDGEDMQRVCLRQIQSYNSSEY
jgi:CDP-glucose 4,6-dehydratase